jgi:hypothetical protein
MHSNNIVQLIALIVLVKGQNTMISGTVASAPPTAPTTQPRLAPNLPVNSNPPASTNPSAPPAAPIPQDNTASSVDPAPGNGYYVYTPNAVNSAYSSFRISDFLLFILGAF